MSLFITIVICDLTYDLFLFSDLCFVNSGSQVGKILLGFVLFLLFVFPNLIGRLEILNESKHKSLSFRFVLAIIFHRFLSLDFVYSNVRQSISTGDLLIGLSYIGTRSYARLGLGFYHFCY